MVVEGKSGFLYEKDDLERLANPLMKVCHDKDLCTRLGHGARQAVEQKFNINRIFDADNSLLYVEYSGV